MSKTTMRAVAVLMMLALPAAGAPGSLACTTFCLRDADRMIFGRNYDFQIGDGMLVTNKRGVAKTSDVKGDKPASWTSRYGSLTFNQFGREFPTGGINEKGLVVELMWLDGTRYPGPDQRGAVGVLEWIQYQLDTRADVADLLAHAEEIRIHGDSPLHYLVADRSGAVAVVEFLDGRLVAHRGADLPAPVLTNDTYDRSLDYLKTHQRFGAGGGSLERFARAAGMVKGYDRSRGDLIDYGFVVLADVAQPSTRWSIVYDLKEMTVHFRTAVHEARRSVRVAAFDYGCGTPVRTLDVNARLEGDVSGRFTDYSPRSNLDLMLGSYGRVSFLSDVPKAAIEESARHPEATRCLP